MALHTDPCFGHHCRSLKEQLEALTLLFINLNGESFTDAMNAIADHRGMTLTGALEHLIATFDQSARDAITADALKCYRCLSMETLLELLVYEVGLSIDRLEP